MEVNKIICGDSLSVLKTLPDDSVDMIMTSPPYFGLRNYGEACQIGLEQTFDEYLKKILAITLELKRVLKSGGSFWLNIGDSYGAGKRKTSIPQSLDTKKERGTPEKHRIQGYE